MLVELLDILTWHDHQNRYKLQRLWDLDENVNRQSFQESDITRIY